MSSPEVLAALARALASDPRNGALWLHYAELLSAAGRKPEAVTALRSAAELDDTRATAQRRLVPLLRETDQLAEALIRAEALLEQGEDPELRAELQRIEAARGTGETKPEAQGALVGGEPPPDDWAGQFDWGDLRITLADVVGLEEVKRQIHLRIVAPFERPEIYRAFGRDAGGGLLLYGPPGCGKTYVARATAGQLGARFMSVSIHEVLDKYYGESERLVHGLFESARRRAPTVLFFDEFDALGGSRGRVESQFWRTLVDQLLQEMDGIAGRNREVLLFAATNMPWNVDAAFRRPGRFDRVLFVPPPDEAARAALVARSLGSLPGGEAIPVDRVVAATPLFTGADLADLCNRAAEDALERSLTSGSVHAVTWKDFERALNHAESSALEWLSTARNYARYSNEGRQYDELVRFLKQAKRW